MKELLYRLPSSRSLTKLFSLLAFAALGLCYPSASFATAYCAACKTCKCERLINAPSCPTTKPLTCTYYGGSWHVGSISEYTSSILDQSAAVEVSSTPGFLRTEQIPTGQSPQEGVWIDNNGTPHDATFTQTVVCDLYGPVGTCINGERITEGTCVFRDDPATGQKRNFAGCAGTAEVRDKVTGEPLATEVIPDLYFITNNGECGRELPAGFQLDGVTLGRTIWGYLRTACQTGDVTGINDVLIHKVDRGPNDGDDYHTFLNATAADTTATCNPNTWWESDQSCQSGAVVSMQFELDPNELCRAQDYVGGQLSSTLEFGPSPTKAELTGGTGPNGRPICKLSGMKRCLKKEPLVNAASETLAFYPVLHLLSSAAHVCEITGSTGN